MDAVEFVKQLRRMDEKGVLKNCFIYPCAGRETDSPEDAVPVVRCKDCKYYDECANFLFDDDYCSRGERK